MRDASGNIMAMYSSTFETGAVLTEQPIYGSSRVGIRLANTESQLWLERNLGNKRYELSNHLGNVLAVVSDEREGIDDDENDLADYYRAGMVALSDYSPFGMLLQARKYCVGAYKFGFNTQERTNEIKGLGNHYTAPFWEYDPRVVTRWNRDPITYPWQSPYAINNNNPIIYSDPLGLFGSRKEAREYKNEHNLSGRINKGDDGIFSIDDKTEGLSYFKDPSLDEMPIPGRRADGVITSPSVFFQKPQGRLDYKISNKGARRLHLSENQLKKLRHEMHDQLGSYNGEHPHTVFDFYLHNTGQSREQIIDQRPDESILMGLLGSKPGGPFIRYVQDPINPQAVIDLRHMLIVGKRGEFFGNSVELKQAIFNEVSATNYQDYYSNYIGYQFYTAYGTKISNNPAGFADYVYEFLNSTKYGRIDTDGGINFYK